MKFYVGVTDTGWFSFLNKGSFEDVNFWQPGGQSRFRAIRPGCPFLFKLKSPLNVIAGLGFFSTHSILPLSIAWDIFGEANGVDSYLQFRSRILKYRSARNRFEDNPNIGCIVLSDPVFFHKQDWIRVPSNWSRSIVQGKTYDTNEIIGRELWMAIETALARVGFADREETEKGFDLVSDWQEPDYSIYLAKARPGQKAFRVLLTDLYKRKCAISGERTLPALEAAHIKPYKISGPNHKSNGILMRADIHKLFDAGYLTVTSDYRVEVSRKIKEEYENGREYYEFHGNEMLYIPHDFPDRPGSDYIEWHNSNVYNG